MQFIRRTNTPIFLDRGDKGTARDAGSSSGDSRGSSSTIEEVVEQETTRPSRLRLRPQRRRLTRPTQRTSTDTNPTPQIEKAADEEPISEQKEEASTTTTTTKRPSALQKFQNRLKTKPKGTNSNRQAQKKATPTTAPSTPRKFGGGGGRLGFRRPQQRSQTEKPATEATTKATQNARFGGSRFRSSRNRAAAKPAEDTATTPAQNTRGSRFQNARGQRRRLSITTTELPLEADPSAGNAQEEEPKSRFRNARFFPRSRQN